MTDHDWYQPPRPYSWMFVAPVCRRCGAKALNPWNTPPCVTY